MIYIFTAATDNYKKYIQKFIETLPLFFPDKDKRVILFSDENYINNINDISITNYHIPHSTYVLYGLNKLNYLVDAFNFFKLTFNEKDDLIMFFDIDTFFLEKDNQYWNNLYSDFINSDLYFTVNPWVLYSDENNNLKYKLDYMPSKEFNPKSCAYCMHNENNEYNIPSLLVSFYGGKIEKLKELNNMIINHILYDTSFSKEHDRFLPEYIDESYINRIVNDKLINGRIIYNIYMFINTNYYLHDFLKNEKYEDILNTNSSIFCIQKYSDIKFFIKSRNCDINTIKNYIKCNN